MPEVLLLPPPPKNSSDSSGGDNLLPPPPPKQQSPSGKYQVVGTESQGALYDLPNTAVGSENIKSKIEPQPKIESFKLPGTNVVQQWKVMPDGTKLPVTAEPVKTSPQQDNLIADVQSSTLDPITKIMVNSVLGSAKGMVDGLQQMHDSQGNALQAGAGFAKYSFGLAGLTTPDLAGLNVALTGANEVLPESVSKWESPVSATLKHFNVTNPSVLALGEFADIGAQYFVAKGLGKAVKAVREGNASPSQIGDVNGAIQDLNQYAPAIKKMPDGLTPKQKIDSAPLVTENENLRKQNVDLAAQKEQVKNLAPEFQEVENKKIDAQIANNEAKIKVNSDKVQEITNPKEAGHNEYTNTTETGDEGDALLNKIKSNSNVRQVPEEEQTATAPAADTKNTAATGTAAAETDTGSEEPVEETPPTNEEGITNQQSLTNEKENSVKAETQVEGQGEGQVGQQERDALTPSDKGEAATPPTSEFTPQEIDEAYAARDEELKNLPKTDFKNQYIHDNLGRIKRSDYEHYSDKNNLEGNHRGTNLRYFSNEALPLDLKAKQLSDQSGIEITPQDIVDYIDDRELNPGKYKASPLDDLNNDAEIKPDVAKVIENVKDFGSDPTSIEAVEKLRGFPLSDEETDTLIDYLKNGKNEEANNEPAQGGEQGKGTVDQSKGVEGKEGGGKPPTEGEPKVDTKEPEDNSVSGISHRVLSKMGLDTAPVEGWSPDLAHEIGKGLLKELKAKNIDAEKLLSQDNPSLKLGEKVALRSAINDEYSKAKFEIGDNPELGKDSKEYKEAAAKQGEFLERTKYLGGEFQKAGVAFQGETDLKTDLFTSPSYLKEQAEISADRDLTKGEQDKAKELAKKVKEYTDNGKWVENITKQFEQEGNIEKPTKRIKAKADKIADTILKGKLSRPDVFSSATPASIVWDGALDIAAKTVRTTGDIAQAVADGIDHLKNSDWYKNLTDTKKNQAEQALSDHIKNSENENLKARFVDKSDNKFTPEDAKAIWEHTKQYLEGSDDFGKAVGKTADDLGLTTDQVRSAIATPKTVRKILDDMYLRQSKLRRAQNEAKNWVKSRKYSVPRRVWEFANKFNFAATVFGHGGVWLTTHAGTLIADPTQWKNLFPTWARSFKLAYGKESDFQKAVEDHVHDPLYAKAIRSGLKIDPDDLKSDSYLTQSIFGKISRAGDKGFFGAKQVRFNLWKSYYDALSDAEKADPLSVKSISDLANYATGTVNPESILGKGVADALGYVFFAPRLVASVYAGGIKAPLESVNTLSKVAGHTFFNWQDASMADKVFAKTYAKSAGIKIATYTTALGLSQVFLNLSGSKQKINAPGMTLLGGENDPTKSDYLKLKAGGRTIDFSSGVIPQLDFLTKLVMDAKSSTDDEKERDRPQDKMGKDILEQARYKLNPLVGDIADLVWGTDAVGRPLPYPYSVKPYKGQTAYGDGDTMSGWIEYGSSKLPIPVSEGIRTTLESMRDNGITKLQALDLLKGLGSMAMSATTGVKIGYEPKDKPAAKELTPIQEKKKENAERRKELKAERQ